MKVVVAVDSFKGSLTAKEAVDCIEKGIKNCDSTVEVIKVPMADGGEGTVQALVDSTYGEIIEVEVNDPLFRKITAQYGILGDKTTAIIEMASASGITLLKDTERNPLITSSFGTGELIIDALDRGCKKFIIGIGGSATNDGGAGMLMALGVKLLKQDGFPIAFGGKGLLELNCIDISNIDKRILNSEIIVACDVDNPLCGPKGASYVFAPQKGADSSMVELLEKGMLNFAEVIKKEIGKEVLDLPGAGAAGGMGAALMTVLNAERRKGVEVVIEATRLAEKLADADLVITGEGAMDCQTIFGKVPFGVAKVASKYKVPTVGICGTIGKGAEALYNEGIISIFSIIDKPMTLDEAMNLSSELLQSAAERVFRLFSVNCASHS